MKIPEIHITDRTNRAKKTLVKYQRREQQEGGEFYVGISPANEIGHVLLEKMELIEYTSANSFRLTPAGRLLAETIAPQLED